MIKPIHFKYSYNDISKNDRLCTDIHSELNIFVYFHQNSGKLGYLLFNEYIDCKELTWLHSKSNVLMMF